MHNAGDLHFELYFVEFVLAYAKPNNVKNRAIPHFMHSFINDPDEMVLVDEESLKETRYKAENDDQDVDDGNYISIDNDDDDDDEKNDDENNGKNDDENGENDNDDEIIIISDSINILKFNP